MARKLAKQGIEMLPADGWVTQHTLAFQLHIGLIIPDSLFFLLITLND
jgi:hypothetical protein